MKLARAHAPASIRASITLSIALSLATGCGPATLQTAGNGSTVNVGGSSRRVVALTDIDDVRDVEASSDQVYVATDRGVLVYPSSGEPTATRITRAQGLPSDDVRALAVGEDGAAIVATAGGLARLSGSTVTAMPGTPPVGRLMDLQIASGNVLWACGLGGVAKHDGTAWVRFGNPVRCLNLTLTPEGQLWVGTTTGLWYVEGDVVREHSVTGGIPEGYVRSVVPVRAGQIMALLAGPSADQLGYYDGQRWYGYTIAQFAPKAIALVRRGSDVLLLVPGGAFTITPADQPGRAGVALVPLSASQQANVRSYRATTTPADQVPAVEGADDVSDLRAPAALAEIPEGHPTIDAPEFRARPAGFDTPVGLYFARAKGDNLFLADGNLGVVARAASGAPRLLRTNDLISPQDLQVATDSGNTWLLTRVNDVALWKDERLHRVTVEDGVVPQAISTGPLGAYLLAIVTPPPAPPAPPAPPPPAVPVRARPGAARPPRQPPPPPAPPAPPPGVAVRIYKADGEHWTRVVERRIVTPTPLLSVPFIGVAQDGKVWAALRVQRPEAQDGMMRGVVVLDPAADRVLYLHAQASAETDGPGAMPVPNDVSAIELTTAGDAWIATLNGAVRVGNAQAVVFGESRGVRGEVVSDLAIGRAGEIWVATAEGVGVYQQNQFSFSLPRVVQEAHPLALAVDGRGNLWGVGPRGVIYHDGNNWQRLEEASGFPTNHLNDVEVDGEDRVWILATDRVLLLRF